MLVRQRAHAKINLALHVTGRRVDGYHELDSIVVFADIADVLTIAPATGVSISLSGPFANDLPPEGKNIILTAWQLMAVFARKKNAPFTPVKFHLEKNLPVASGIGGGSADAAAALRGLVQYFELSISPRELNELALQLGTDVPICLIQKTSRMRGIGEIIEPIAIKLSPAILLVNPNLPSSTAKVFETLGLKRSQSFQSGIGDVNDMSNWRNDLTSAAIRVVPEIANVIEIIKSQPNIVVTRMSGSGATCFGLARNLDQAEFAATVIRNQHPDWWVAATTLI